MLVGRKSWVGVVGLGVWLVGTSTLWRIARIQLLYETEKIKNNFWEEHPWLGKQVLIRREDAINMVSTIGLNTTNASSGMVLVVDGVGCWENDHNVVHVVHTQLFLQHKHPLVNLGQAGLELLQVFTVPSVLHQSNQQFLWILWTDPNLNAEIRRELLEAASKFRNAVVLGTGKGKYLDFRSMNNGISLPDLHQFLMAGDFRILLDYHKASQTRLLLESHLDAGDAFSKHFIESVQAQAAVTVGRSQQHSKKMEIFCPEDHMEWSFYHPPSGAEKQALGYLMHFHGKNFCVGTGFTVAYNIDASSRQLLAMENKSPAHAMNLCRNANIISKKQDKACAGQGTLTMAYRAQDLHQGACPTGSFFCRDANGEKVEFGGSPFRRPSGIVDCKVDGPSNDYVVVSVSVSKTNDRGYQTGIGMAIDGDDYRLAAVYMKGGPGGNLYTWNWNGFTGGAKDGTFVTPDDHRIGHVDLCVIPTKVLCKTTTARTYPPPHTNNGTAGVAIPRRESVADALPVYSNKDHTNVQTECRRNLFLVDNDTKLTQKYVRNAILLSNIPVTNDIKDLLPQFRVNQFVAEDTFDSEEAQQDAWTMVEHDFGIRMEKVLALRQKLGENMEKIRKDARLGYHNTTK